MLQISNRTPFQTDLALLPDQDGIDTIVAVLKATFAILPDQSVRVAEMQMPVVKSDEYWREPGKSSIKYASETTLPKPATDIVMIGHACAPEGKMAHAMNVRLQVGKKSQKAIVFGDRFWKRSLGMWSKTDPLPFSKLPLIYENAFGGADIHPTDNRKNAYLPENPVGCGFRVRGGSELEGVKVPNIEDPVHRIDGWKDHPKPVGFGYIGADWKPRRDYVGTYDDAWRKNRAPFLPKDFDSRFFNSAHPTLIADGCLQGGEPVIIENVGQYGMRSFQLPKMKFGIVFDIDGHRITAEPNMDTLIVEPDDNRFSMIWRAAKQCDKKALKIRNVEFYCLETNIDLGGSGAV